MGVQESESTQPAFALSMPAKIWNEDLIPITDQKHGRPALTVDEQSKLPTGHFAETGQFMGLLTAVATPAGVAAAEDTMEKLEMAGFETTGVADNFSGYKVLLFL
jgi:hypothetical protein